jgi:hypothetical protein
MAGLNTYFKGASLGLFQPEEYFDLKVSITRGMGGRVRILHPPRFGLTILIL